MQRTELLELEKAGVRFQQPFDVVRMFESEIAKLTGAPYAVATDCCTHAIELCLRYLGIRGTVRVPTRTYPSVPMTLIKLGIEIEWSSETWKDEYALSPSPVVDSSLLLAPKMYRSGLFQCLSFHTKKHVPIGRGGMILTDNAAAADWLRKSAYDGRDLDKLWKEDPIEQIGYHYYMTPEDAARGLLLLRGLDPQRKHSLGGSDNYPDISQWPVFKKREIKCQ